MPANSVITECFNHDLTENTGACYDIKLTNADLFSGPKSQTFIVSSYSACMFAFSNNDGFFGKIKFKDCGDNLSNTFTIMVSLNKDFIPY